MFALIKDLYSDICIHGVTRLMLHSTFRIQPKILAAVHLMSKHLMLFHKLWCIFSFANLTVKLTKKGNKRMELLTELLRPLAGTGWNAAVVVSAEIFLFK